MAPAGKATLARPVVERSPAPLAQFGTGNFKDSETTGFFLSPIPGEAVNFKGSKFGDDYSNELPAKILALTTVATPLLFIYLLVIS
mmetsp:Transcript_85066/g.254968  ORF Transcript_85066/g.254968 Transcript_85066/m.254968 type:complete len:86 (-) Transcript_85066:396-653(-)